MAARAGCKRFIEKNLAALTDFMEDSLRIVHWYLDPANYKDAMEICARIKTSNPIVVLIGMFRIRLWRG